MIEVTRLTDRQPRDICALECGARCCRSPKARPIVRGHEMHQLQTIARERGLKAKFLNATGYVQRADGFLKITDRWQLQHVDGKCPFLGDTTNLCTIYDQRPGICRDFPTRPVQGCLLNPGGPGDPEV